MALGALEAIQDAPVSTRDQIVIIGFDGVQEARVIIDRGSSQLVNTIVQDRSIMASTAIDQLFNLVNGEEVPTIKKLKPILYRRIE
jgi:DNA-binding LacI/PurR family transcriptional regulator